MLSPVVLGQLKKFKYSTQTYNIRKGTVFPYKTLGPMRTRKNGDKKMAPTSFGALITHRTLISSDMTTMQRRNQYWTDPANFSLCRSLSQYCAEICWRTPVELGFLSCSQIPVTAPKIFPRLAQIHLQNLQYSRHSRNGNSYS